MKKRATTGKPWMDAIIDGSDLPPFAKRDLKAGIARDGAQRQRAYASAMLKLAAVRKRRLRSKLGRPVNHNTGRPLRAATIQVYARDLGRCEDRIRIYRESIRLLIRIERERTRGNLINLTEWQAMRGKRLSEATIDP